MHTNTFQKDGLPIIFETCYFVDYNLPWFLIYVILHFL